MGLLPTCFSSLPATVQLCNPCSEGSQSDLSLRQFDHVTPLLLSLQCLPSAFRWHTALCSSNTKPLALLETRRVHTCLVSMPLHVALWSAICSSPSACKFLLMTQDSDQTLPAPKKPLLTLPCPHLAAFFSPVLLSPLCIIHSLSGCPAANAFRPGTAPLSSRWIPQGPRDDLPALTSVRLHLRSGLGAGLGPWFFPDPAALKGTQDMELACAEVG